MGYGSYSSESRYERAVARDYYSGDTKKIFEQTAKREIHESMDPRNVTVRESRDSEQHPNTTPIILFLDITGSMGHIPHMLVKDGLPTLVGSLIQNGVKDVALMFGAIGDHECDRYPLQVGQFESGDEEMDMWLTRVYLEGGGGGNAGESYPLAWYFAAFHTATDAEKREQKGFLFTIGDEPFLENFPMSAIKEIMGDTAVGQGRYTAEDLLKAAQKKYHVFHIHVHHGYRVMDERWIELLGDHVITTNNHNEIPKLMSNIILGYQGKTVNQNVAPQIEAAVVTDKPNDNTMML